MSVFNKVGPLQSGEQIADSSGRPTPRFMRLWQSITGNGDTLDRAKQNADGDLDGISDLIGTGLVARTDSDTYATRTLQAGAGISITNPGGVAGNPEIAVIGGAGACFIPLVDGAEPPSFITDGAGQLILVAWSA